MRRLTRSRRNITVALALAACLPLVLAQGCPFPGLGTAPTVSVTSPATNATVPAGTLVTVVYSAQSSSTLAVAAFYDRDGAAGTGDEVSFATGLITGTNVTVLWNTTGVPGGTYRVGVVASDGLNASTAYAPGAITVSEAAAITFATPLQDAYVNPGAPVTIRFAASIAGAFTYTAFYDQDGTFDNDETTVASGSGNGSNVIDAIWTTPTNLLPGTYYVGVRVKETGTNGKEAVGYAAGRVIVVGSAFAYVLQPANFVEIPPGTLYEILFSAGVPGGGGTIDVFYDPDQTFNGNETIIAAGLSLDRTSVLWDTLTVPGGTYYIGTALRVVPGATPVVAYAPGRVTVVGDAISTSPNEITVTTPLSDTTLFQGDVFTVRWSTGATLTDGTVSLFRDSDADNNRIPDGAPVQIVASLDPTARQYAWNTAGVTGRFYIIGRLIRNDGTTAEDASPSRLTIRTPFFWIGETGTTNLAGAVLRGFNFQDHAGSSFTKLNDVDGDEIDDFLVISQYGKPALANASGVGAGEAYLIYGNSAERLTGTYDLNRTGSTPAPPVDPFDPSAPGASLTATSGLDQGIIFSGVAILPGSNVTTGITLAMSSPDMDGDELDELVFAIPKADSLSLRFQSFSLVDEGILEDSGQFLRGGIIIVSSTNSLIADRSAVSRDGNRVLRLQEVGQVVDSQDCASDCNEDVDCPYEPCLGQAFADTDDDGKCDAFDYGAWRKGFLQPLEGIDPPLASPQSICPLSIEPGIFPAITGMFTDIGQLEPYGCRILGQALEDGTPPDTRFGTTMGALRSSFGPEFLLIAAPNQTATQLDVPELPTTDRSNSGIVYVLRTTNYWDSTDLTPRNVPRPHQYIIRSGGFDTGFFPDIGSGGDYIFRPFSVVGPAADARIATVTAIPDFNGDTLEDFVVGSPNEGTEGRVYIVFRRLFEIEGNYLLERLALAPSDSQRLNGVLIQGEANDRLGENQVGSGDFNDDGRQDVVVGIPNHRNGQGAVLIVFAQTGLISPINGFRIDDMVANGDAALIVGVNPGDLAGFNVASAGDVDGDGTDDLLVAAPGASPSFDSDGDGTPDTVGLDIDGNRVADDLDNNGQPDDLTGAGIIYVILGSNQLIGEIGLDEIGTASLRGRAFVGRAANDNLGGGISSLGLGVRGKGLASAGDVDSDGKADILIGAPLADPKGKINAGEAYLIYGGFKP